MVWQPGRKPEIEFFTARGGQSIKTVDIPDVSYTGFMTYLSSHNFVPVLRNIIYPPHQKSLTFDGHRYRLFNVNATYAMATAQATAVGGSVLAINSESENSAIKQFLLRHQLETIPGFTPRDLQPWETPLDISFWLQGERVGFSGLGYVEADWKWPANHFLNWRGNHFPEPNNGFRMQAISHRLAPSDNEVLEGCSISQGGFFSDVSCRSLHVLIVEDEAVETLPEGVVSLTTNILEESVNDDGRHVVRKWQRFEFLDGRVSELINDYELTHSGVKDEL